MENREYSLVVGLAMLVASIIFFIMPAFFNLDAFIPIMIAIVLLISSIMVFFMGFNTTGNQNRKSR